MGCCAHELRLSKRLTQRFCGAKPDSCPNRRPSVRSLTPAGRRSEQNDESGCCTKSLIPMPASRPRTEWTDAWQDWPPPARLAAAPAREERRPRPERQRPEREPRRPPRTSPPRTSREGRPSARTSSRPPGRRGPAPPVNLGRARAPHAPPSCSAARPAGRLRRRLRAHADGPYRHRGARRRAAARDPARRCSCSAPSCWSGACGDAADALDPHASPGRAALDRPRTAPGQVLAVTRSARRCSCRQVCRRPRCTTRRGPRRAVGSVARPAG